MDTVSNGGFLQFSAGGILSPLPGDLARDYGPCDYDIRHNLNAQYVYQLPLKFKKPLSGLRAEWLARGWPSCRDELSPLQGFGALVDQPRVATPNCLAYSVFSRCQPPNFIASPPTMR